MPRAVGGPGQRRQKDLRRGQEPLSCPLWHFSPSMGGVRFLRLLSDGPMSCAAWYGVLPGAPSSCETRYLVYWALVTMTWLPIPRAPVVPGHLVALTGHP